MNTQVEREFGWDDEIEKDGVDYITLPEGDYNFVVTGFERARHNGSDKLPPCNKAIITIQIEGDDKDNGRHGIATIRHNLFLHSKCEGMLSAFFVAIGQKKKGEKLKMNWNTVVGSIGRAKVGLHSWTNDSGVTITNNEIRKFYEPEVSPSQSAPKFTPGSF